MTAPTISPSLADNPLCSDWLTFEANGRVTLKTAKVEIGQGILTALVQIAADELDISPDRFDVISGHTKLGPVEAGTSSSLSTEVTGKAVRHAASATRKLLLTEAATLLQAEAAALTVEHGVVHVDGRETPLTLSKLAETVDLAQPAMDFAAPKNPSERRVVGTSLPRIDLRAKINQPAFIQDIAKQGMRHGRAVQPPSGDHRLATVDEDALAKAFPSVTIVRNGSFIGIVADDEAAAMRAADAAADHITWAIPTPPPKPVFDTLKELADPPDVIVDEGDVASAPGQKIALEVTKPYIAHASIAPSCAIATWHSATELEVISHTQSPHGLADGLGVVFGLDGPRDVTVIHQPSAGTYGHSGQDDAALDAALLAKAVPGVPVRVLWSRADDFQASPAGCAMVVRTTGTLDGNGRIAALSMDCLSQPHARRPGRGGFAEMTNAALLDPPLPVPVPEDVPPARGGGAERNATPLYAIPNLHVQKRILKHWPVRTSALRGLGAFANVYALESLMDELAEAAGQCPVAFRVAHLDDTRAAHVIERAAEMAGWPGPLGDGEAIGIGFGQYKNRSAYCAVAMHVRLEDEIRLLNAYAAVDSGEIINPDGIRNQVEGSIIQAASWTLKEALAIDGSCITTDGWETYPILRFSEVPAITVELIERPELPPLGVGETAVGPTGAAIGNAVKRALGLRLVDLPLTRDAVQAAINQ
ncbi:MAG: molybdopterin cofactor-binding domain-containing protein [Hyphomicrobiaceae bacterium]